MEMNNQRINIGTGESYIEYKGIWLYGRNRIQ